MKTKHYKIVEALRPLLFPVAGDIGRNGGVWTKASERCWLKSGQNFTAARKVALNVLGIGVGTWREFLAEHGLQETWGPSDLE